MIGCGPVGLCALIAATSFSPARIFAIDSVPSRLELAKSLGAEPLNFIEDKGAVKERILEATDGRGADVVLEVVGNSPALRMGFDVVRPWGLLISVGVHNAEVSSSITAFQPFANTTPYPFHWKRSIQQKCKDPVRQVSCACGLSRSTGITKEEVSPPRVRLNPSGLRTWCSHIGRFMADKIMPMTQAEEGYELFDKMKVQKVIFRADQ